MESPNEQPKFNIRPTIEQKPFESAPVQTFFRVWNGANDSILPQFIERNEWEQLGSEEILGKMRDGKRPLYIPTDLKLWEMIGVMEAVDRDTFADTPERQTIAKQKMIGLGKKLQNSGIYIAQRLNSVDKGKPIAVALAEELYGYGKSLTGDNMSSDLETISEISSKTLSDSELDEVDNFLAGDKLYLSRQERAKKASEALMDDPAEQIEEQRKQTLSQFFSISEKALLLQRTSQNKSLAAKDGHLKPWHKKTPFHSAFINRVEQALAQQIALPRVELDAAIFRRGLAKLVNEMKAPKELSNIDLIADRERLMDALEISMFKTELESIRKSGDVDAISSKERHIADIIQMAVSIFPQKLVSEFPASMVIDQYINCVGASILGGSLMREVGLNYLAGSLPDHAILFLVTTDGHVEWRDMLRPRLNGDLTNNMIEGNKADGTSLKVEDIVAFSKNPTTRGVTFDMPFEKYREKLPELTERQGRAVTILEPETGLQVQVLNSLGNLLFSSGHYEEAIETLRQAVAVGVNDAYPYFNMAQAFRNLNRYEESIESYRQALAINPNLDFVYEGIGGAFYNSERYEEAIEAYRKTLAIDPTKLDIYSLLGRSLYNTGQYEQAAETFRQALAQDPKRSKDHEQLAHSLYQIGDYKGAVQGLNTTISLLNELEDREQIKSLKELIRNIKKLSRKIG